jgi:hypothetical protein
MRPKLVMLVTAHGAACATDVGSHSSWRIATPLPVGSPNSDQDGGSAFLIFVADSRTARWSTIRVWPCGSRYDAVSGWRRTSRVLEGVPAHGRCLIDY